MPGKTKKSLSVEVSPETADRQLTALARPAARRRTKASPLEPEAAPPRAAAAVRRGRAKTNGSRQTRSAARLDVPHAAAGPAQLQGEVARLAYSFWEERGGQAGSPEEDWFRAESEILGRMTAESNR